MEQPGEDSAGGLGDDPAARASEGNTPLESRTPRGLLLDASGTLLRSSPTHFLGVEIFPDAHRLLGACRRRSLGDGAIRTAVVTNWGHRVNRMLEALGIADCFDAVVNADDVRHAKPHAEIFHMACDLLELPPASCVHVGDSLFDDALGAQAAGLDALWIHRRTEAYLSLSERTNLALLRHPHFPTLEEARLYLDSHLFR
jgi:putative hydrolase of the HAD superfamily